MTCPLKPASRRLVSTTLPLLLRRDDAPMTAIVRGLISASIAFNISSDTLLARLRPHLGPVGILVMPVVQGTHGQCPSGGDQLVAAQQGAQHLNRSTGQP